MTLSQSIIMSIFEIVYYLFVTKKLIGKTIKIKYILITVPIGGILVGLASEILTEPFGTLLSGAIFFSIILSIYKIKIEVVFKVYLLSTILITAMQLLSLVPIQLIKEGIEYNFLNGLVSQIITLVIVYITYRFI